jgi:drug/metabolite transporter (DMT)-like permease
MLVTLSIIWGSAFFLVEIVLEEVPPLTLVAGRLLSAFLFLGTAFVISGRRIPRDRASWQAFVFLGVVNNVFPFIMLTWGQDRIDSSQAAILVASMPLSTVLIAHFWINERLTVDRAVGVLIGFGGVFMLVGADLSDLTGAGTLGQFAVIAGAVGYSTGTVFARRYLQDADIITTATGQTFIGTAIMIPLALAVDFPIDASLSAKTVFAWMALGVFPSGVAYLIFFRLVRQVSATQASMVTYLIPVTAILLGVLVLDETVASSSFAGLALIVAGIWVVNGGGGWLWAKFRRRQTAVPTPVGIDDVDADTPTSAR